MAVHTGQFTLDGSIQLARFTEDRSDFLSRFVSPSLSIQGYEDQDFFPALIGQAWMGRATDSLDPSNLLKFQVVVYEPMFFPQLFLNVPYTWYGHPSSNALFVRGLNSAVGKDVIWRVADKV